jgi:DNA-binding transcriptional LysR family regulator
LPSARHHGGDASGPLAQQVTLRAGALPAGHAAEEHHHAPPDRRLLQPPQCLLEPTLSADSISALLCFVMSGQGIGFSAALPIRKLVRAGQLAALPIRDKDMNTLQLEIQSLVAALLPNAARAFLNTLISGQPRPVLGLFASSLGSPFFTRRIM